MSDLYTKAGVNIKKGNEVVKRIKKHVASTHTKMVLKNIGSFGGLFELTDIIKKYKNPVLVQSIDGVGTKLAIARMAGKYISVGEDIVGHSCGDILAMGARPLTFLDYVANEKLVPKEMEAMVKGMVKACREANVALIGGETAEMPGTYAKGEHDIAGCITGIVEKDKIITGEKIKKGDIILGFASSGLHTNGFSLARKLIFEIGKYKINKKIPELGSTIGTALLKVHKNYTKPLVKILDSDIKIRGIAHITGGGFIENIPRILPKHLDAEIKKGSWPMLPIFPFMQNIGKINEREMYTAFNMSIGLMLIIPVYEKRKITEILKKYRDYQIYEIGKIIKGNGKVQLK
ncbi:phosphoribosylformylglycinamidine cyclo-ligase [Candidatus Nomurabacteria bacterium RIFCSPHIGHO2_01_FULL_40_12]|uniref:Phosphoribosylformylglycinamidine cyclo-ligase n=1 Tax=Candidatus Nomurabacteria bacterium RIFCSPHIGHO2_01_FULL_40_12 TaxID=1801737 RepID=A0A1F6V0U9_9BACT|nr:MAG: phosphoribosylformylglycinamidine cyclo-ligase [Candidatus Nomurabacteria bacterium RIFCSPHIGHO2_01_FULL_40_12]